MPVERSSAAAAAANSSAPSERDQLESVLRECKWNKNAAAEKLGISYKTLLNKIHSYGLD
jgi:DNA-binding NtrC family response regulator